MFSYLIIVQALVSKAGDPFRILRTFQKNIIVFMVTSHFVRRIIPIFLLLITYHLSLITFAHAQAPNPSLGPDPAGPKQLEEVFARVISVSAGLAFVILLFALIWGGVKFLISGGESKAIQQAQQTITWAALGMFFLILAWVALLLIESFTGVKVTIFCVNAQGCQ